MAIIKVTPTLPWKAVSSDATNQMVNTGDQNNNVGNNIGMQYFHVAVDSADRIFIQLPISYINNQTNYQWVVLDNTQTGYPVGAINEINCSFTYTNLNCVFRLIIRTDTNIYVYKVLTSVPGTGISTYGWEDITPVGEQPTFTNQF